MTQPSKEWQRTAENAERLYTALRDLYYDLVDSGEDRTETGREYETCRKARELLEELRRTGL